MIPSALRHTDPGSIEARWGLRRIVVCVDETLHEGGAPATGPTRAAAAAVIRNPWIGRGPATELERAVTEIAPRLAKLLTDRILLHLGGVGQVCAVGKGAIVGVDGELEHGAALIHTPFYANLLREFLGGDAVIAFADDRGDAGTTLTVPLGRKDAGPTRDFFQTIPVRIPDAPRADEIVVVVAASSGTRPFPRSGDRTTDPRVTAADLEGVFQ